MSESPSPDTRAGTEASLVRATTTMPDGWNGTEHRLQVHAAKEAGLDAAEVELDMYTEGFRGGLVMQDAGDNAIVARGRTILSTEEFRLVVRPLMRFLSLADEQVALQVHDGKFEFRVFAGAAEGAQASYAGARAGMFTFVGVGVLGAIAFQTAGPWVAAIIWTIGAVISAIHVRRGVISGRAYLAGRIALGLAMIAQSEKTVLPPADLAARLAIQSK